MRISGAISDEGGQVAIITALCMVVIVGFMGLALDVGHFRYVKRNMQNAADAAAMAAAVEVRLCGGTANCAVMRTAAQKAMSENGFPATTVLTNCSGTAGTGVTLMINNPSCAVATDPNLGKTNFAEVVVTDQVPTYFARVLGINTVNVAARAEAERGVGGPCVYSLGQSGNPGIQIIAGVLINSSCAIVDESTTSNAFTCVVGLAVSAPRTNISGGATGLLCSITPAPHTYVPLPQPNDPLAYLPAPPAAANACGTSTGSPYTGSSSAVNIILGVGGNYVFNPGVYCGGISITAGVLAAVTFNPGIYVLRQGPGILGIPSGGLNITISALSSIVGQGVMFYNQGPIGSLSVTAPTALGLSNFVLSAPTSGTYGGMLFFQAHGLTTTGVFVASLLSSSKLEGAIYLPDAPVSYGVAAGAASYNILVANTINFNVAIASTFGNNYSALSSGSPLNGDNVTLVE
jgi:Flp pilus assembly protein TadG